MLRLFLTAAFLMWPALAFGQATNITTSGTLPVNCTVGNIYLKTGASAGFYVCVATDTWTGPLSTGTGDVTSASTLTDEAIVRGDGGAKGVQTSLVTISDTGALSFPDDVRQAFNPGTNVAGLNVGAHTAEPSSPSNGDMFYDSTAGELKARIAGVWVTFGSGGGSSALSAITAATTTPAAIASGDNRVTWNWTLTTDAVGGITFGETAAATTGTGNQAIVKINQLTTSTANGLLIDGFSNTSNTILRINDVSGDTTPFFVDSNGGVSSGCSSGLGAQFNLTTCNDANNMGGDNFLAARSNAGSIFYFQNGSSTWIFRSTAAGSEPIVFQIGSTEEARIDANGIRATGYQAADGSAGVTVTSCTQFEEGICTAGTEPAMTADQMVQEIAELKAELAALRALVESLTRRDRE
jgi:hypothetical protein